ncbi:uncharacterized protein LOC135220108 [Macrobrachium nipponense]|uniref:uncharacterized protein LOC135220108 n=1 Tax=Macrobrachium nipponense TaxID=159736 RepID=UPI0030C86E53
MARQLPCTRMVPSTKLALQVILLSLGQTVLCQTLATPWQFDIFEGLVISTGSFNTSTVPTVCECKRRCYMLLNCKAWSVAILDTGKECQLADHYPGTMTHGNSIFGVYAEGSSAYTTTTTTTTPQPTTTINPNTYELRFFKEGLCSKDRVLSGVSVKPTALSKSHLMYTVCFKAKISPTFTLDTNDEQIVSTGPDIPSQMCEANRVLVGFVPYGEYILSTYKTSVPYDNPLHLPGKCHFLKNWQINTTDCVTLQPTAGSWTGQADTGTLTIIWDYWISCDPFYVAVQLTRQLTGVNRVIQSMKCCKIVPIV